MKKEIIRKIKGAGVGLVLILSLFMAFAAPTILAYEKADSFQPQGPLANISFTPSVSSIELGRDFYITCYIQHGVNSKGL